jgi:hypothetical protein
MVFDAPRLNPALSAEGSDGYGVGVFAGSRLDVLERGGIDIGVNVGVIVGVGVALNGSQPL